MAVASAPGADGAWAEGEVIAAEVRFSAPVTVDTAGGTPALGLVVGGTPRTAEFAAVAGAAALRFVYRVAADDAGAQEVRVAENSLALNGGTIRSAGGADAELGFTVAPVIIGVAVAPEAGADGSWTAGESIEVRVSFSAPVTVEVTEGRPTLGLLVGGAARAAVWSGGSETAELSFGYAVTAADGPVTAVGVAADSLALNGGTLRSAGGADAELGHAGLAVAADRTAPGEPELAIADARAREGEEATLRFTVRLSGVSVEPVTVGYATADGTATAGADYAAAAGTLTFAPGESAPDGRGEGVGRRA